tara:strand:- start:290 stop:1411 length:1122 start_codon:yes stop_codon:yes gene_type:complete
MVVKVSKPEINVREKISELDKPSGTAGQAMLAAETPQEQFNLISAGRRNLIFNGDMRVAQRGTGAFTANGDRPVDRWQMISNTNDFTTTQSSTVPVGKGFTKSVKIQPTATKSPSSSTYARIGYSIEGYDGASLCWGTSGAKSATISFWVRASVTGIYSIGVKNTAANRSICLEYTIDSVDTWEYKTITFSGVTDGTWEQTNSRFCYIDVWQAGQGSQTSTIGTWQNQNTNMSSNQVNLFTSTSNTFYITGFQMEVGKVATPFEHRSYGEELALCQRYYQKVPSNDYIYDHCVFHYGGDFYASHTFMQPMRANPSVTIATQGYYYEAGAAYSHGSITVRHITPVALNFYASTNGGTSGYAGGVYFKYTADAEL